MSRRRSVFAWIGRALVALAASSHAQQPYTIEPHVAAAGGSPQQSASGYTLDGTVGQAGVAVMAGTGAMRLEGGFWRSINDRVFADGFEASGP